MPPALPLHPVNPDNACSIRITAAAGTYLAGASWSGTVIFFPADRALHTEILLRSRGVAASGFPPLCNIPHCCLPQESGPCLSPNVAGRPLRPATDRRFGGPLPRQLANQTRAHPIPPEFSTLHHAVPCAYAVLAAVSGCYPPVWGRLPTRYSPVRHSVAVTSFPEEISKSASFDLHVLGTPPAFILSQDQTLMIKFRSSIRTNWLLNRCPFPYCFWLRNRSDCCS